jgi:hypothetical protein
MKEMLKNALLGLVLIAACTDVEDDVGIIDTDVEYVSSDAGVGKIAQASFLATMPEKIEPRAVLPAGWVYPTTSGALWATHDVALDGYNPNTIGNFYGWRMPNQVNIQKAGSFGWCNYANGNPNADWSGIWCDNVWYTCPSQITVNEASFGVWWDGIVGHANYNWNAPGSNTQYAYWSWYAWTSITLNTRTQPTLVTLPGGGKSFTCGYSSAGLTFYMY